VIKSVKLGNFLSFGKNSQEIELRPLNIIVGANGCGKSNFLEAFGLLRNATGDIKMPIRDSDGVMERLYKGTGKKEIPIASVDMVFDKPRLDAKYHISFTSSVDARFEIVNEWLKDGEDKWLFDNKYLKNDISFTSKFKLIAFLVHLGAIRLYRDWTFGRDALCRKPQIVGMSKESLAPDCSNLAFLLDQLNSDIPSKRRLLKELQNFYPDIIDYVVDIIGNYAYVFPRVRFRQAYPRIAAFGRHIALFVPISNFVQPQPAAAYLYRRTRAWLTPRYYPLLGKAYGGGIGKMPIDYYHTFGHSCGFIQ